ncbi:MAG: DNA gyrase modulator, partial [Pseudomonadota bacterium]
MSTDLSRLAEEALAAAKAAGAAGADTLAIDSDHVAMALREGTLETAERAQGIELGLRVFVGQRQATVSISDTRSAAIRSMAERAVAMAREAPEDPYCGLADPAQLATERDATALGLADAAAQPSPEALTETARRTEAAALAVPGVDQVSDVGAATSSMRVHLAASNGFSGGYARTSHQIHCVAIAGTGLEMERDYCVESRMIGADMP